MTVDDDSEPRVGDVLIEEPSRQQDGESSSGLEPGEEPAVLRSLPDGFSLKAPLTARVWQEQGEFVARIDALRLHAFGDTRDEALDNLRHRVVDQFRRFQELRDRLAPPMADLGCRFQEVVQAPDG